MKVDLPPFEIELELFRKTWNQFKLKLLESYPVNSALQSLFLLEVKSHLLTSDSEHDLQLSNSELKNVDSFLVRFEDHCIPRILFKFERFKSQISHQTDIEDKNIQHVKTCTIGQTENVSANHVSFSKDANDFVSDQKLIPEMEIIEENDISERKDIFSNFVMSKMVQSDQSALDYPENAHKTSVTRRQNSCNSEIKNKSITRCVSISDTQSQNLLPETLTDISHLFQPLVNNELKSVHACSDDITSNDCFTSKLNIMSNQKGLIEIVSCQSERKKKQILCPVCGHKYLNIKLLKQHIKTHTDNEQQKCTSCKTQFQQRNKFKPHLLVCLCGQRNSDNKQTVRNSCIILDSVTNQHIKSQYPNNKQLPRHNTSECTLPLNFQKSSKSCSVKSYSKSHQNDMTKYKQFKCDICQVTFLGLTKLKRHKLTHTGERLYKCSMCGTTFADKSHLNVHIRSHSREKPFKCDICESSFSESTKLKNHKRIHTGEKPYVCEICGLSFSILSSLRSHMKTHSGERPFKCTVCDFTSAHSSNLKAHLVVHTGDKKFVCDKCGASFSDAAKLKRHKMVHTGERPYNCEVCGTRFADKSHLTVHMRIHSGEKPFKCTFCDSAFVESSKLKNHVRTHTGEKPYVCEICGMSFAVSYSLKSHMRRHTGEKPYKCDICKYATSQSSNLKTHMVVHTGARSHACDICGASFSEQSKLKRHQIIHQDQKEGSIESSQQNNVELNPLPPELFYNFSTGSGDGVNI